MVDFEKEKKKSHNNLKGHECARELETEFVDTWVMEDVGEKSEDQED